MTGTLVRKLLRDVRLPLAVVALLLVGFQCLWAKITQRITDALSSSDFALQGKRIWRARKAALLQFLLAIVVRRARDSEK